ncbi:RNA-binding domain superfamily [Sesbania bispinosa]|nr:RNA-binding domain superfamily [Sesbania bispinosa]
MDSHEAIKVVLTKINNFDPHNALMIISHVLLNHDGTDLIHLASSPDHVLLSYFLNVKCYLGLSSPPSSSSSNHLSQSHACPNLPNNPIHPNSSPSFSKPSLSPPMALCDSNSVTGRSYFSHNKPLMKKRDDSGLDSVVNNGFSTNDMYFGPEGKNAAFTSPEGSAETAAIATAAVLSGDEFHKSCRPERNDSFPRRIYITFPAESTFKDRDVSEYFSNFGPVQDVRIPYQTKRMFGFVTFVYPETVRLVLSKGNPHFICDSRLLVKPYKEKGKLPDKRLQHQQQPLEREEISPCLSSSGLDSKEPNDHHLGVKMLYNPREWEAFEMLLRVKSEEQAEIELQQRRLLNLQLAGSKNSHICHHQHSLPIGASLPLPQIHSHISNPDLSTYSINGFTTNPISSVSSSASAAQPQEGADPACIRDTDSGNGKDSRVAETTDLYNRSVECALPDSLYSSPTIAAGDNLSDDSPTLAEINGSGEFSTSLELKNTNTDSASY